MTLVHLNAAMRLVVELGLKGHERDAMLFIDDNCAGDDTVWLSPQILASGIPGLYCGRDDDKSDAHRVLSRLIGRDCLREIRSTDFGETLYQVVAPTLDVDAGPVPMPPVEPLFQGKWTDCPSCKKTVPYLRGTDGDAYTGCAKCGLTFRYVVHVDRVDDLS